MLLYNNPHSVYLLYYHLIFGRLITGVATLDVIKKYIDDQGQRKNK